MWTDHHPGAALPELFATGGDTVSFAGGLPDLEALPLRTLSSQVSRLMGLGGRLTLQYTTTRVAPSLVPAIRDLMGREGASATSEQLVPTTGSQMGLLAVALGVGAPGDPVLLPTPAYPGAAAAFRTAGMEPRALPEDADGPDPAALYETVRTLRADGRNPRLLYCNPTFRNPTGATIPTPRRRELLAAAADLELLVVEDNPYGLLAFDGSTTPALHALDPERVIYLGTFSKVFAPGLRCGWIAAPEHLAPALRRTAEVMTLSPSALSQATIAAFHTRHGWDDLLDGYRTAYRERCALMADALDAELGPDGPWRFDRPDGGFYLWLRHRDGQDTERLTGPAAAIGVSFVPGSHFGVGREHAGALRLAFSNAPRRRIAEGVCRLAAALAATPAPPARGGDR
ncbi:PLP-dependent aminotransferase family protein [Streptomyces sp. ODS05-4]|uniref:aminotransferase-like domain-containing protein n=1 Tax=Streptomyces sp. ODS05-4 TaxID=2944939 RepID=UPI00210928A0|nr:PLP-dependent aminotransferase family protein [Streptomyces sp. ODS05-4]